MMFRSSLRGGFFYYGILFHLSLYLFDKLFTMETNKILDADFLDILFDGKNKEYGAYDLRKNYNKRIRLALICTGVLCLLIFMGYALGGRDNRKSNKMDVQEVVKLEDIKEEKKNEPPLVPKVKPPKIEMAQFTRPKIEKDDKVKENEKPPEQEKLEETKIGTVNQEGIKDEGITAPPVDEGKGVVEAPKEDYERLFTKVEIESDYPGGPQAWQRYLYKNLHYPEEAVNNDIQGAIVVRFIVDKEGNVSDVEAISGPNELRDEAMRVIRKSGKWVPAVQNGRQVKSYKSQSIQFKIDGQ
jgi:protein TonB